VERASVDTPLTLRVHSGLITNRFQVSTLGWSQTMTLQPKLRDELQIASGDRRLVTLDLTAVESFVPAEMDPASTDTRPLGVWVEIVR
jgi:hypothetical protein